MPSRPTTAHQHSRYPRPRKVTILTHLCRSIAIAGHAGDRETVAAGLINDLPEARRVALGAAARIGMLDADTLLPHLADPDPGVRHRAIEVAARLPDGERLLDRLIELLGPDDDRPAVDAGPTEAEVAAFAIGELDLDEGGRARAETALARQATGHPDALCRESAVAALGALGVGLPAVLAATEDVATVRRRAVLALAPFEGPEVDRAIEAALEDRDWQVRQAAEDLADPGGTEDPVDPGDSGD